MHTDVDSIVSLSAGQEGEVLRVAFIDSKSTEHTLVFRIDDPVDGGSGSTRRDYKAPLIESRVQADWINPITCVPATGSVIRKTPLTWQEAAKLIDKIKPLVNQRPPEDGQALERIEQAIRQHLLTLAKPA